MSFALRFFTVLMILALPLSAAAQGEDQQPFIYATYFNCDVTGQERADEIVTSIWKGIYDDAVKKGTISAWGWLAHQTGGQWRRLSYYVAPNIDALMAAGKKIGDEIESKTGDSDEFGAICNTHEDYIWQSVTGSGGTVRNVPRGKVGISTYHVCDISKESRADELDKSVLGPVLDKHTGRGKLSSWGWSKHFIGGKYRRLMSYTADDWPNLFAAQAAFFADLADNKMADQFSEICNSHSDYMWDIQHEKP